MKGYGWMPYILFKDMIRQGNHYKVARVRVPRVVGNVMVFGPTFANEDRRREMLVNSDPMNYGKANGYRVYCLYEGFGLSAYDEEQYDGDFRLFVHDELCRMADWYVEHCMTPAQRANYRDDVPLREAFKVDPSSGKPTGAVDRELRYMDEQADE